MNEISRINYKRSDLLYEFSAETRLTVYRRLDIGKPRPKATATFWDFDLFEHVSRWENLVDVKMCHMENVLHVLKFDFVWVWESGDNVNAISIWVQ